MAIRAAGLATWMLAISGCMVSAGAQRCNPGGEAAFAGGVVSLVAVGASAIFDIATAPLAVRRYNNERRVSFAPYLSPRDRSYGVSVSWSLVSGPIRPPALRPLPAGSVDSVHSPKFPIVGFGLSLLSTAAPIALGFASFDDGSAVAGPAIVTGVTVGPSVGHFYAGRRHRGLRAAALRGLGLGAGVGLLVLSGCSGE